MRPRRNPPGPTVHAQFHLTPRAVDFLAQASAHTGLYRYEIVEYAIEVMRARALAIPPPLPPLGIRPEHWLVGP